MQKYSLGTKVSEVARLHKIPETVSQKIKRNPHRKKPTDGPY